MRRVASAVAILALAGLLLLAAWEPTGRVMLDDPTPAPILLYAGRGTSPGDVDAFERLLGAHRLRFSIADSAQLDAMPPETLRAFRLVIVPGGNFEAMGHGLAMSTAAKLRAAVHGGVSYLGVCAGAFIAGDSPYNGFNLTNGRRFGFYSLEADGLHKAAVAIRTADGAIMEHYWEDGPQLDGWGAVVAKYPDGTAAVVQGRASNGWIVLAGVHPEAPESWRDGVAFRTPARDSNAYAITLIESALERKPLPTF